MRIVNRVAALTLVLGLAVLAGCDRGLQKSNYKQTEKFHGQLVQNGTPVSFAGYETVSLDVINQEKGERFGIPLAPDGTFDIKWMPTGKYSAMLTRIKKDAGKSGPKIESVPDFEIQEGKTEYQIELGKKFKP